MTAKQSRWPTTDAGLLDRMRDLGDQQAWGTFLEIYGRPLDLLLRRRGISTTEALDVVQETFLTVVRQIKSFEYDDSKRFRGWLATVALRIAWHRWQKEKGGARAQGGSANLHLLHNLDGEEIASDLEYRLAYVLSRTQAEVSEAEWEAFHRTMLTGEDNQEVAQSMGIDVGYLFVRESASRKLSYEYWRKAKVGCYETA